LEGSLAESLDSKMCLYSNGITDYTMLSSPNQTEIFDYTKPKQRN